MRQSNRDNRKYVIAGLLAILLIMTVGFAAFSTSLTINGTANISTSWCVGFDNRNTNTYQITKGLQTGTTPTATMSYSGTACSTNYVPTASLGANFYQPGDKIEYTLTIANKSSIDAVIEGITVDNVSVTSDQTITKGNIIWKVYMPSSTTLTATTGTTTMVVSAEFQNTSDITNMTSGESQTIAIGINTVQSNGSNGMTVTPATFTGTIYRNNTNILLDGLPMSGSATVWYPTNDYSSAAEAFADYYVYPSQAYCENDLGAGNCSSGTVTMSPGSYETNASSLNKTYYLKHTVANDIVTASYVCFVTDTEHCMQGGGYNTSTGTSPYYTTNRSLLESQESWFNNHSGSCLFGSDYSYCSGGGFNSVGASSDGNVDASVSDSDYCSVSDYGNSYCGVSDSGGGSGGGGIE